ncbi:MAG: glycosyltransferase [Gemmatimonadetes bacterium]|nr:glycosyltransferase [Gemmatimonadota bacterium]NNL31557.1 glycosyltransferase [Gemmatimonadota bacterium]
MSGASSTAERGDSTQFEGDGPVVSVIIPVRNGAAHLDEALDSMVGQTLRDIEVVVVDDGSVDSTPDILARWVDRDARVRALRQGPGGIVRALERGRAHARGEFIARMDADDISEPSRLQAQVDLLRRRPELSGCGCGVRYFPDEIVRDGARRYERWINHLVEPGDIDAGMFVECPLPHPTFFFRAEALDVVGGYRETAGPEDYELILRMWSQGHRFGKVPDVLLRWREGDERLSRTDARYSPEAFLATKVRYLHRTLLRPTGPSDSGLRAVVIWGAGPVGKAFSRALQDVGVEVVAFVDLDPRKIGQQIHGAPVLETPAGLTLGSSDAGGRAVGSGQTRAPPPLHLAAVGQEGARRRITRLLSEAGKRPLRDFIAVA